MKRLLELVKDECGVTAIEYGLIIVLVVIGIIASVQTIGHNFVVGPMTSVSTNLTR